MTESSVKRSRRPVYGEKDRIRVLHVDDDWGFLEAARKMLELQGGFQVETACSVKEAWRKLEAESFDAVVSDYKMSERDGLEFLKQLRDRGNQIPFVMFTGKGREEVVMEALNLGADQYLNKHGEPETMYGELAHSIRKAVKSRRMEERVRQSEKKYRLLAENTTDVIFVLDMNLDFKYVSPSAEELFGYSSEGQSEITLEDVMTLESYERALEDFREAVSAARDKPDFDVPLIHYEFVDRDGFTFWGEVNLKFLRDQQGRLVGVRGILRDISPRKEAEEALRERYGSYLTRKVCEVYGWTVQETG